MVGISAGMGSTKASVSGSSAVPDSAPGTTMTRARAGQWTVARPWRPSAAIWKLAPHVEQRRFFMIAAGAKCGAEPARSAIEARYRRSLVCSLMWRTFS